MKKEEILKKLKEINKKKYSILKLGLFGSFSKNSDTANSDIDILVKMEFKKGMYQNFCNLHKRLEEIFQKKVDLVDESMFEYKFKNPKVQKYKDEGYTVYFVGDGPSDYRAIEVADFSFVRKGTRAIKFCQENEIDFFEFENFDEILNYLKKQESK